MKIMDDKKQSKLNIMGMIKWEGGEWTIRETLIILLPTMLFILLLLFLLKEHAIPAVEIASGGGIIKTLIAKFIKSRSP